MQHFVIIYHLGGTQVSCSLSPISLEQPELSHSNCALEMSLGQLAKTDLFYSIHLLNIINEFEGLFLFLNINFLSWNKKRPFLPEPFENMLPICCHITPQPILQCLFPTNKNSLLQTHNIYHRKLTDITRAFNLQAPTVQFMSFVGVVHHQELHLVVSSLISFSLEQGFSLFFHGLDTHEGYRPVIRQNVSQLQLSGVCS